MILTSANKAFISAITLLQHNHKPNELTNFSTYLSGEMGYVKVHRNVDIYYGELRDAAIKQFGLSAKLCHPNDFFLSPEGVEIEVPNNWEDYEHALLMDDLVLPAKWEYLSGIHVAVAKPSGFQPLREYGGHTRTRPPENQPKKIELWVGSGIKPIATITLLEGGGFELYNKKQSTTLLKQEDVLREAIKLSKIFKYDEQFSKEREAYLREFLPDLLKP